MWSTLLSSGNTRILWSHRHEKVHIWAYILGCQKVWWCHFQSPLFGMDEAGVPHSVTNIDSFIASAHFMCGEGDRDLYFSDVGRLTSASKWQGVRLDHHTTTLLSLTTLQLNTALLQRPQNQNGNPQRANQLRSCKVRGLLPSGCHHHPDHGRWLEDR